jgi:hypothetical protein
MYSLLGLSLVGWLLPELRLERHQLPLSRRAIACFGAAAWHLQGTFPLLEYNVIMYDIRQGWRAPVRNVALLLPCIFEIRSW